MVEKIHHVAYRCRDARETVEFYRRALDMELVGCMAEDKVPSTKAPDPYMHVFLDAGGGNILAFFELPNSPPMDRDRNTPEWVQHIALQVRGVDELLARKGHLEAMGIAVVGPINHEIFKSIYFHDPNGLRLELSAWTATPELLREMKAQGPAMIEEWSRTKKPPRHVAWAHDKEFAG
ncbi:MAG: VOC family protein [Xanthobacteraceae bacterium]